MAKQTTTDAAPAKKGLNMGALKNIGSAPKKPAKPERPTMKLSDEAIEAAVDLVEIRTIANIVKSQDDNQSALVKQFCFDEFVRYIWKNKGVPTNPKIETMRNGRPDHSLIYQFRSQFKIDIPDATDDMSGEDLLLEALSGGDADNRLAEEKAIELIKEEIDMATVFRARPLNELLEGHYEQSNFIPATPLEQSAGEKLQGFLLARATGSGTDVKIPGLTDEEADVALQQVLTKKVRDPKAFLARVCTYCRTEIELRRVFSVIQPQQQTSHMKFAQSDSVEERNERLSAAARRVIGMNLTDSDD